MAFHTISSNVPIDLSEPLISFKVRGREVAALYPDGTVISQGDSVSNRAIATQYLAAPFVPVSPKEPVPVVPLTGVTGPIDGGLF